MYQRSTPANILKSRELLYFFVWRDFKVRYKQTVIGAAWAVLQPLTMVAVLSAFLSAVAKFPSQGVPYPVYLYSGILFSDFFSRSVSAASSSLVNNADVLKKVSFPRIIPPIAATVVSLVDMFFAFFAFVGLALLLDAPFQLMGLLTLPLFVVFTWVNATGIGLFFGALNIKYRDIGQVLPFLLQTIYFATPVIYPIELVPSKFQWILFFNPTTGALTAWREQLFGTNYGIPGQYYLISVAVAVFAIIFGYWYFRSREADFADMV